MYYLQDTQYAMCCRRIILHVEDLTWLGDIPPKTPNPKNPRAHTAPMPPKSTGSPVDFFLASRGNQAPCFADEKLGDTRLRWKGATELLQILGESHSRKVDGNREGSFSRPGLPSSYRDGSPEQEPRTTTRRFCETRRNLFRTVCFLERSAFVRM